MRLRKTSKEPHYRLVVRKRARLLASFAAVLVGLAALASACGESTSSADLPDEVTTIAPDTAVPDGNPGSADWNRYEGKILRVELPSTWRASGYDDVPEEITEGMGSEARAAIESGQVFYAIDTSPEAMERWTQGGLAASFSVQEFDTPPMSWKQFVRGNSQPPDDATSFESMVKELAIGRALEVTYAHGGPPLNQEVMVRMYLLMPNPGHVIGVTMETTPDLFDEQAPLFDEIAGRLSNPSP
jgi:hypothetical protein